MTNFTYNYQVSIIHQLSFNHQWNINLPISCSINSSTFTFVHRYTIGKVCLTCKHLETRTHCNTETLSQWGSVFWFCFAISTMSNSRCEVPDGQVESYHIINHRAFGLQLICWDLKVCLKVFDLQGLREKAFL